MKDRRMRMLIIIYLPKMQKPPPKIHFYGRKKSYEKRLFGQILFLTVVQVGSNATVKCCGKEVLPVSISPASPGARRRFLRSSRCLRISGMTARLIGAYSAFTKMKDPTVPTGSGSSRPRFMTEPTTVGF